MIGTHGTGKTTYADQLYRKLTRLFPNEKISLISDIARQCPFPVNRQTCIEAQLWIFHKHILMEIEAVDKSEYIICDRTVLDNLAYAEAADLRDVVDACLPMALWWMERYTQIFLFPPAPGRLVEDGFRDTNPAFQSEIHNILTDWVRIYDIPVNIKRVDICNHPYKNHMRV